MKIRMLMSFLLPVCSAAVTEAILGRFSWRLSLAVACSVIVGDIAGSIAIRLMSAPRSPTPNVEEKESGVPTVARYLICLVFPSQSGDAFLGDLEERFWRIYGDKDFGPTWARFWYCFQVVISLRHVALALFKRLSGIAAAYELIRRVTR
jgi:hypothetical protein